MLVVHGERLEWRRQANEQLRAVVTGAIQLVEGERPSRRRRHQPSRGGPARTGTRQGRRARLGGGTQPRRRDGRPRHRRRAPPGHHHLREPRAHPRSGGEGQSRRRGAACPHPGPQPPSRKGRRHRAARSRPDRTDRGWLRRRRRRRRLRRCPGGSRCRVGLGRRVVRARLCPLRHAVRRVGSLASRTEDAQSVAGPVTVVLLAAYFASFAAIGRPDSGVAKLASFFPPTAPLAMPNRIAMGATAWWEPVLAAALTLPAIVGLVYFGGRVYAGAILRTGPTIKSRDAWRGTTASESSAAG